MGEGSYWRRFLSQVLGNELLVAGTWMVVVTRIGVWGGRRGIGPGVPRQVLVPQEWGDMAGSGGSNEILQLPIPLTVPEMSSNSNTNFQEGAGGSHPDGKHNER